MSGTPAPPAARSPPPDARQPAGVVVTGEPFPLSFNSTAWAMSGTLRYVTATSPKYTAKKRDAPRVAQVNPGAHLGKYIIVRR